MSNYAKSLLDSFASFFSNPSVPEKNEEEALSEDWTMNSALPPVSNERVAHKLKGYLDVATEIIDKAVRCEEWGLPDDALVYYNQARSILSEAKSARSSSHVSSSEQEKVNSYYQKILKWEGKVLDRLQVLNQRSANSGTGTSMAAKTVSGHRPSKVPLRLSPKSASLKKTVSPTTDAVLPEAINSSIGSNVTFTRRSNSIQESLKGYDPKLVEMINSVILDRSPAVKWDDVAGLDKAKQALLEMVILPTKRRDLFIGLRRPTKGLLLFGPPGNGKTMLAKAVASESDATFFNISASSLTSKWVGESEKLVRVLFAVAIARQPSIIFMDEIDSIMSARTVNENESSRRLKSEFLIQLDGVASNSNDLVIVIGATNKPQELDDAVLRRLVKRIYVPLPDERVRRLLFKHQLKDHSFSLPDADIERLVRETEGYSGSDLKALCEEAAWMPIRELGLQVLKVKADQVRSLRFADFQQAMSVIRPSLGQRKWEELEKWNKEFGSQ